MSPAPTASDMGGDSAYTIRRGSHGEAPARPPVYPWTSEEAGRIQALLAEGIPEVIQHRPGRGGGKPMAYMEGWTVFHLANEAFGFNGWSSEILEMRVLHEEVDPQSKRVSMLVQCVVRVYLRDGTFHDDFGSGDATGSPSRMAALEQAYKAAVTDARKRAIRLFGYRLGGCTYDEEFTRKKPNGSGPNTSAYSSGPNTFAYSSGLNKPAAAAYGSGINTSVAATYGVPRPLPSTKNVAPPAIPNGGGAGNLGAPPNASAPFATPITAPTADPHNAHHTHNAHNVHNTHNPVHTRPSNPSANGHTTSMRPPNPQPPANPSAGNRHASGGFVPPAKYAPPISTSNVPPPANYTATFQHPMAAAANNNAGSHTMMLDPFSMEDDVMNTVNAEFHQPADPNTTVWRPPTSR